MNSFTKLILLNRWENNINIKLKIKVPTFIRDIDKNNN